VAMDLQKYGTSEITFCQYVKKKSVTERNELFSFRFDGCYNKPSDMD
jgi:hypothetical protein